MGKYSIKDLENISKIKAHTIRIWEQRYNLLRPKRTKTNIRYYDDNDLKLILNVALLKDNGIKISHIAKMHWSEFEKTVIELTEQKYKHPEQIHLLTLAMINFDEEQLEHTFSSNLDREGFEGTIINMVNPALMKINMLWQTGSVNSAQKAFIYNFFRQKIIAAIDKLPIVLNPERRKFLFYLMEGDMDEILLLCCRYILLKAGLNSVYFGQQMGTKDIVHANTAYAPDYLFTTRSLVMGHDEFKDYLLKISDSFKRTKILVLENEEQSNPVNAPSNVKIITGVENFRQFIEKLG